MSRILENSEEFQRLEETYYIRASLILASGKFLIRGFEKIEFQPQGSYKNRFLYAGFYCIACACLFEIIMQSSTRNTRSNNKLLAVAAVFVLLLLNKLAFCKLPYI